MAYLAQNGVGYFFSINSANGYAFDKISKAIRAYITRNLEKPLLPPDASMATNTGAYAGWYQPDSPRVEMVHFLERLLGLSHVRAEEGQLSISSLGGWNQIFLPVTEKQFRHVPKKDPPDPVANLALLTEKPEGRFIQTEMTTIKRIPAWIGIGQIRATAFVLLSILSILIYAPFWMVGGISKRRRRPLERPLRLFPLLAVVSLLAVVGIFAASMNDLIARMGNLTAWSAAVWVMTLIFAVTSIASVFYSWQSLSDGVRRGVRRFARIVSLALLIATVYLTYWGVIGLRTWA
jgi:hypothetical protein